MIPIALASEFPNDNPALHCGAIWVIETPCAMPVAEPVELRVARMVEELVHDLVDVDTAASAAVIASDVPHEPLSLDLSCEPERVELAAAPPDDADDAAYEAFDDDDAEAIEIVDDLDAIESVDAVNAPAPAPDAFTVFVRTLAEVAVAAGAADAANAIADALAGDSSTATAWRAIINGESEDLTACGAKALDEWAAELVARVIASPSRADQLRRELRSRGVAAFGLVA